jgi:hypothetical protein
MTGGSQAVLVGVANYLFGWGIVFMGIGMATIVLESLILKKNAKRWA